MRWKDSGFVTGASLADGAGSGKKGSPCLHRAGMTRSFRAAFTALALTLSLPACAQTAKPANDADPALWVVKDADTTIYLCGTIHVLKPGLTWFDESVKTAFDRSDEVKLELVMPDPATMQGQVKATGLAPAGTPPLVERLPVARRAAYTQAVIDAGCRPMRSTSSSRGWRRHSCR